MTKKRHDESREPIMRADPPRKPQRCGREGNINELELRSYGRKNNHQPRGRRASNG